MSSKSLTGFMVTALVLTFYGNYPFLRVAEAGPEDRMERQVRMFERVLDDMLIESPNFLVHSHTPTLGTYVDGRGVVFTFRAGLNDGYDGNSWNWHGKEIFEYFFGDDDRDRRRNENEWDEYLEKKQEKLYARGKDEIVETLQDFGGLLSGLDGQDWVEIKIRLRDSQYFREHDIRRLNVRVRVSDIRAFADGTMDSDRFRQRVEMDES